MWKFTDGRRRVRYDNSSLEPFGSGELKIVAAFQGMHVSPAKHNFGKCDRKVWQTDRQTDGQTDNGQSDPYVSLCFAVSHFFPHTSRSLLCIQFVAVAFQSEEEDSWRKGPRDLFLPRPGSALGGSSRKTTTLVREHEYLIPTKFHQNPSSGSREEVENVKVYRRTTNGALWQ